MCFAMLLLSVTACATTNPPNVQKPLVFEKAGVLDKSNTQTIEVKQWHTLTLSFEGPYTSESSVLNPFTDYRLLLDFIYLGDGSSKSEKPQTVRGFYAADGNAAQTSARAGKVWQVRFSPDKLGEWSYSARLEKGSNIAISRLTNRGESVPISNAQGRFSVVASNRVSPDFRAQERGRLIKSGRYFRFSNSGQYWLKGGARLE